MKAADYTLIFYWKCLSQHVWDWRSRFVTSAILAHHERNEEMLKQVAHERGSEFLDAFNQHTTQPLFPFAGIPATETNTTQTPNIMKLEITIPDELFNPLVQAIDRLTAAVTAGGFTTPTCTITSTIPNDPPVGSVGENTPTEAEKPKAGRPPKKEKAATPEPTPVVKTAAVEEAPAEEVAPTEAPAEVKVPTGPELSEKVKPLAAHPALQADLIRYKANELKVNGPIRLVEDTEILAKFDAKVIELLARIPAEV